MFGFSVRVPLDPHSRRVTDPPVSVVSPLVVHDGDKLLDQRIPFRNPQLLYHGGDAPTSDTVSLNGRTPGSTVTLMNVKAVPPSLCRGSPVSP